MTHRGVVVVAGLGDLGSRVINGLARLPEVELLIAAGRRAETGSTLASQAALVAQLTAGAKRVEFVQVDLEDQQITIQLFDRLRPEVLVLAASRVTWWRPLAPRAERAAQLALLPYGTWLPVHVALLRGVMEARRESGVATKVVALPFPDAVGPALAPLGQAPDLGAGNVMEVGAKLAVLAARAYGVDRDRVRARLVMHHAAERFAFGTFGVLSGPFSPQGEPPWQGSLEVDGKPLPNAEVESYFREPYPLGEGRESQEVTAAATVAAVSALLSDTAVDIHAPAPGGLPGGYPVTASRAGLRLDLPAGMTEEEAIAINEAAARWDGIERIEADGTIVYTDQLGDATERILGLRLHRVPSQKTADVANELLERATRG